MIRQISAFIIAVVIYVLSLVVTVGSVASFPPIDWLVPQVLRSFAMLLSSLIAVVSWELCASRADRWSGFRLPMNWNLGIAPAGLVVVMGCAVIAALLNQCGWPSSDTGFLTSFGIQDLVVTFAEASTEEFVYRYIMLGAVLSLTGSRVTGIVLSTALFVAMHGQHSTKIFIASGGLWFAAVYVRTGSIWLAAAIHFICNTVIVSLFAASPLVHPTVLDALVRHTFDIIFCCTVVPLSLYMLWPSLKLDPVIAFFLRRRVSVAMRPSASEFHAPRDFNHQVALLRPLSARSLERHHHDLAWFAQACRGIKPPRQEARLDVHLPHCVRGACSFVRRGAWHGDHDRLLPGGVFQCGKAARVHPARRGKRAGIDPFVDPHSRCVSHMADRDRPIPDVALDRRHALHLGGPVPQ